MRYRQERVSAQSRAGASAAHLAAYRTANAAPWNPNQRPGDNLWTTAIFARDPQDRTAYHNEELKPTIGTTIVGICPAARGGKDWQPSAYSPRTKLIHVPHQHLCMNWKSSEVGYIEGTPFVGATVDMYAGPGGEFMAWDPAAHKEVGSVSEKFPVWSRALVTAGRCRLLRYNGPLVQKP